MLVLYIFILMFTNSINHIKKNIHPTFINRISIITILISTILSYFTLNFQSIGKGISIYSGLFQITIQSQIIEIILLIVGMCILISWVHTSMHFKQDQMKWENNGRSQYSLIAIFSIIGGSLLMSSLDLLSMFLSIELQSFALYILSTLNKDNLSSTSAGLKYFLLGSLSSCFILLGSAIIYSITGLTQFESMNSLMSVIESSKVVTLNMHMLDMNKAFMIGLIIIIIGFLFKISAAPFYQWAPDVYDGTPTIVTVWLTLIVKLTILTFLLSLFDLLSLPEEKSGNLITDVLFSTGFSAILQNLLLISSLLSLLIGTVVGLSQIKIKRLLAFSSISHVGFLLLALSVFTQKSIDSFMFYLVQYSITNLNIFLILLAFAYKEHKDKDINYLIDLKGEFYKNPVLSISLAICLFSMAGIPPLIGFFSKQFVLFSSIENGNYFISIIAILISVISASYYLKLINLTFFTDRNQAYQVFTSAEHAPQVELSQLHSYIISILSCIILFFFINPELILNGTQLISLTIFHI